MGLIHYHGPGENDPLVKTQLALNIPRVIKNTPITEIHAYQCQSIDDDVAVQIADALRFVAVLFIQIYRFEC